MAYNHLNYLLEVKHVQSMIAILYNESAGFGTMAWMWRKLRDEKKFFACYHTFVKYANEPRINERIERLQNCQKVNQQQLKMF